MVECKFGRCFTLYTKEDLPPEITETRFVIPRPEGAGCDDVPEWDVEFEEFVGLFLDGKLKGVTFADFLSALGMHGRRCVIRGQGERAVKRVVMFII